PVRRVGVRWRPHPRVHREAADRRGLDQRRLLRARTAGARLHRRRRREFRERRPPAPRGGGPTRRLPARQVLAVHGHAPRQAAARSALAGRPRPLEGERMSGFWQDRPTLVTGGTGLVGGWVVRRLL